ncbi:BREX-1 system adenine-specific DNA-methyltransferase PglX [Pontibacter sp. Tf4]|uniref:BREX-1 system adenine-specific DNA-methyltransferase PglX n=1 Tax=Pontibacter sp. Tf4 TaxID=2761620 RepID=UPI001629261B|nr:BREX-1 system adenine-specific DNA-methyltransferase PglX [Pontibacter sp. Tf4]MBB6610494.1 BREX-1 system adenine-specific DNA-methyltransferase PglX [Pontibacter sp. Tf4]
MNTNKLKRFAQEARKKLIEQVGAKLEYVLHTDTVELREKALQVKALKDELARTSKEQLMEKVAYTWFNRLIALRFMDVNNYQPLDIRVISPKEGYTFPELLDEAKQGHIAEDLKVNAQQVYDLLDGRVPSANPQNEAYKVLLIAACNHLHTVLPFLFERINDYTELLLPDDLTSEFSIVHDVREGMAAEDCQQVEIIGWLYQFYISEKKDEVFASKAKVKKEDIPAATQLFTPRWIIEYMVQNTVGKLWLQNRPNSRLREHMPYFIESASLQSEDYLKISSPEEITLLDQACGSGHILVYGFELLTKIYEEEGINPSEIPKLIIQHNLYGFEIDERAAQLAAMALMMKARSYQRRFFKKGEVPQPHILCFQDMKLNAESLASIMDACNLPVIAPRLEDVKIKLGETLFYQLLEKGGVTVAKNDWAKLPEKKKQELEKNDKVPFLYLHDLRDITKFKLELIQKQLTETGIGYTSTEFKHVKLNDLDILNLFSSSFASTLYQDLLTLQQATNLGSLILPKTPLKEIEAALKEVQEFRHQDDAFYQYQLEELKQGLEHLQLLARKYTCVVDNPPYMGGGNMNAPLADFVKRNYPDSKADLMACFMESGLAMLQPKGFLGMINQHSWMFLGSYEKLRKKLIKNTFFDTLLHLGSRTFPEIGGEVVQNASFTFWKAKNVDNGKYIRLVNFEKSELKRFKVLEAINNRGCGWYYNAHQRDFEKIPGNPIGYWLGKGFIQVFAHKTIGSFSKSDGQTKSGNNDKYLKLFWEVNNYDFGIDKKWVKHPKGGSFRRWYGNLETVIDWSQEARLHYRRDKVARILPDNLWWKKGISWTLITTGKQSFRDYSDDSIFNLAAPTIFFDNEDIRIYSLGLLNTVLSEYLLKVFNPTLNCNIGEVQAIPLLECSDKNLINSIVLNSIDLSKKDWDSRETSWDFVANELLRIRGINTPDIDIEESYDLYQQYWRNKFFKLHKNEEELNRQFIEIYGLQEELTPDVPLEDITIIQEETSIDNGELIFHADEVMAQFVSYAVGCMFGRFSLDKPGLILANQGETLQDYLQKVAKSDQEISFLPDADNIIPILDDEWFEDDIVGRFHEFLKVTFGEANFAKNLAFVEECLGKDIRKYFVKDFYNDHVRRYKKRPIYWQFSSPQGSFNVLIYMHRYTPDTVNNILNKYLREYQEKLRTRREHLDRVEVSGSATEKTKAIKERARIDQVLLELQEYEREILYPLATERLAIDLDNGVLVNYNLFGKAVKAVPGLNDAKTKKKVAEFDWVKIPEVV